MNDDIYGQIATKIIEQQETIIGPVAVEQAQQIAGLAVNWSAAHTVQISGDGKTAVDSLVQKYRELFGQISVEVCKEAATKVTGALNTDQLPQSLQ